MPQVPIPESPGTNGNFQTLDSTRHRPPPSEPDQSKRSQGLRGISNRRKFGIAVIVALAVAAVVTLSIVLTRSDDNDAEDDASAMTNALTLPHVAVGNLTLVNAKTEDNSKEQCLDLGWIPTGVDWVASSGSAFYYLCMQQSVEATDEDDVGAVDLSEVSVMRRLVVLTDVESCPINMQTLTNPSANTVVCLEFASANESFSTQQYVVDVMTTTEAFYNHDTPGWITWPTDLKFASTASSVFLSARYPVRPIVGLEVLTNVPTESTYSACDELEPEGEWEAPGFVLKSSDGASSSADSSDVVVCVQRPQADANDSLVVLRDLTVVLATESCPEAAGNVNSTEITSNQIKLCAEWGTLKYLDGRNDSITSVASPFVAELALYETTDSEAGDVNISTTIPGDWQNVGDESTGNLHTFFLTRKFEPSVLNSTSDSGSGDDSVTSSVEAVVASNNSEELSFRVLQIADLHLTGDPDYACSNAPTGPYRASLLESAAAIARDIKQGSGSSSSDLRDDPLYNECREAWTIAFLDELLDIEQPDFVIFSGDNVHTSDATNHTLAMSIFTNRTESRGIPWAAVFGNHDTEGGFSRDDMVRQMIEGQQYSHVKYGPPDIGGVGNYEVNVVAPADGPWGDQGSTVFRMYFLDSHADIDTQTYPLVTDSTSYDWIKESQIDFYRELASSHATEVANSSATNATSDSVPAVMYFHIPVPEYALASTSNRAGSKNEETASAEVNCGLFSALVEVGDVKATFVGHDHVNEYCYLRQGIQLCYGGGIGMGKAYGLSNFYRRTRVLEWTMDANQKRRLRSWKRYFDDPTQTHSLEVLYSD
ncbi:purple acid phosphatase [Phytophthora boehmeriae]|uniref:Purple acid phosphatase n=1 Tax=Phytophthora boehmeriae TaxID=109152 RepID=A0A8T1WT68_9STRA|nr:purple acid phosphatase [Phytophthora boehmeriae]